MISGAYRDRESITLSLPLGTSNTCKEAAGGSSLGIGRSGNATLSLINPVTAAGLS